MLMSRQGSLLTKAVNLLYYIPFFEIFVIGGVFMLLDFKTKNHKSFAEEKHFSMTPAP